MKTLIIPRILGGLGNQLFSYSAARRLALKNDAELVLDDVSGFAYDSVYQRHYQLDHFNILCRKATAAERLEPFSRLRRVLKREWNQRRPFAQRSYLMQDDIDYDPRLIDFKPQGTVYLQGYWQSEGYFKDVETQIRNDLCIKPPEDELNLKISRLMRRCNAVAVHVRYFDQTEAHSVNNISNDYYARAIAVIEHIVPDAHFFIFSDQPNTARLRIPLPNERITVVSHNKGDENAYADLWLMTKCQHFVIANSTFSWWGAWLAANPEKVIIAPKLDKKTGMSFWGFNGLIPDSWMQL